MPHSVGPTHMAEDLNPHSPEEPGQKECFFQRLMDSGSIPWIGNALLHSCLWVYCKPLPRKNSDTFLLHSTRSLSRVSGQRPGPTPRSHPTATPFKTVIFLLSMPILQQLTRACILSLKEGQ